MGSVHNMISPNVETDFRIFSFLYFIEYIFHLEIYYACHDQRFITKYLDLSVYSALALLSRNFYCTYNINGTENSIFKNIIYYWTTNNIILL